MTVSEMSRTMNMEPRAVRGNRHPLTLDQIRQAAPSAFAAEAYHAMSSRYAYVPTSQVIDGMMQAGFQPFAASQSRTKIADKKEHTKHMIRFRAPNTSLALNEVHPEIVMVNSHDGTSAYKLMAGLFRLVCSNGMIVADSLVSSLNVRHSGNIISEVATGSVQLVEQMPAAIDAIARWKQIQLEAAEQALLAEAAHDIRFADSDGKITTPILPGQLLHPRRHDDKASDLWSVFSRIQENVIKGGLHAYKPGTTQRTSTRAVKGIDQDVRLNRALWVLGEKMAELKQRVKSLPPRSLLGTRLEAQSMNCLTHTDIEMTRCASCTSLGCHVCKEQCFCGNPLQGEEPANSASRNCERCGVELPGAYEQAHHDFWHQRNDAAALPPVERHATLNGKCTTCGRKAVLHSTGECSWCTPVATLANEAAPPTAPLLGQNPAEALRLAVGGRRIAALKESRTFDTERLARSPLFERKLF